ncbi:hypothetical protein D3C85_892490 [compost metagenome]
MVGDVVLAAEEHLHRRVVSKACTQVGGEAAVGVVGDHATHAGQRSFACGREAVAGTAVIGEGVEYGPAAVGIAQQGQPAAVDGGVLPRQGQRRVDVDGALVAPQALAVAHRAPVADAAGGMAVDEEHRVAGG